MHRSTRSHNAVDDGVGKQKTEDALSLIADVRQRFADDNEVYDEIIHALQEFKKQKMKVADFARILTHTLKDHNDLKARFNQYLPGGFKLPITQEKRERKAKASQDSKFVGRCSRMEKEKTEPTRPRREVKGRAPPERKEKESKKVARGKSSEVKLAVPVEPRTRAEKSKAAKKEENQAKRPQLRELEPEVAERVKRTKVWMSDRGTQHMFDQSVEFVRSIKDCYEEHPDILEAFFEAMKEYASKKTSLQGLLEQVAVLFQSEPSIMKEFKQFLGDQPEGLDLLQRCMQRVRDFGPIQMSPTEETADLPSSQINEEIQDSGPDSIIHREMGFFRKIKGSLRSGKTYSSFLKLLSMYNHEIINREQLEKMMEGLLGQEEGVMEKFYGFLDRCDELGSLGDSMDRDHPLIKLKNAKIRKKDYDKRPIQELDTSGMERCTPSYLMLPLDYPHLACSGQTEIGEQVLNGIMVSLPTGSEECGSKQLQKNSYEELLFKVEDKLHEMDVSMSRCKSTLMAAEKIHEELEPIPLEKQSGLVVVKERFTPIHIHMIKNLYGTRADKIFDMLQEVPMKAIRVVISRLRQKLKAWEVAREELMSGSKKIVDENYLRSLDHQSHAFKQGEKKQLSVKAFLPEIQSLSAKMADDPDMQIIRACGQLPWEKVVETSHLSFRINDSRVVSRLVHLVHMGMMIYLSKQDRAKIFTVWQDFIIPFMGLSTKKSKTFDMVAPETARLYEEASDGPSDRKEDDLDNQDRKCVGCKPLEVVENDEASQPGFSGRSVLYCTDQHYHFFRLFQTLHDRLSEAFRLFHANCERLKASHPSSVEMHFFSNLNNFLRGGLSPDEYEDHCRRLLGVKSYVLFTLDKLIERLCKQLRVLGSGDTMDLYKYEQQRSKEASWEHRYFLNARLLLPVDQAFRIECRKGKNESTEMRIQLLDWLRDFPIEGGVDPEQEEQVAAFISSDAEHKVDGGGGRKNDVPVFLRRNLVKDRKEGPGRKDCVYVANGLECKMKAHKLVFIPGTEDFLCYLGKRASKIQQQKLRQDRGRKVMHWLEHRNSQRFVISMSAEASEKTST
ncbi:hypothetical protein BSKO_06379 [Bryopsis sp. KO-2023]|nr:hypothetical protein BSKO_06379 [Bryopsis sp. KO-2023]